MSEIKVEERLNDPDYNRFKLQGENRFLAKVHKNQEYKVGGIIVADTNITQNIPTTGEVVAISRRFDHDKFPDVKPGAQIKVVMNSWSMFESRGETLGTGDADYIIACYDPF